MRISRVEEFLIDPKTESAIQELLSNSFPDYPSNRIYFKQVPSFRYLVWKADILIAHVSVDFRIIRVGEEVLKIFFLGDVCVKSSQQHRKVASEMIADIEKLAVGNRLDFLLATVSDPSLYLKNGFEIVNNDCRWVLIQEHTTYGVRKRNIQNSLMVKKLGDILWNEGAVDLLGHMV